MNSKFKCTHCGTYNRTDTGFKNIAGKFCDKKCGFEYYIKSKSKYKSSKRTPTNNGDIKSIPSNDVGTRLVAAVRSCHAYIKKRDAAKPCICCGERLSSRYHAGHFLTSGNHSFIRFHEDNIHGQNYKCNMFEGGDSGDYESNLRQRIGDKRVDWLLDNRHKVIKRTADDYLKIELYFKKKILSIG